MALFQAGNEMRVTIVGSEVMITVCCGSEQNALQFATALRSQLATGRLSLRLSGEVESVEDAH